MKIEILVIDENAIVVKGLRSAMESRMISKSAEEEHRNRIMATLAEEGFTESAMAEIIGSINKASENGKREALITGYGDRHSPFRRYYDDEYNLMEEIIQYQIFPILRKQGYQCQIKRGYFATNEKYFSITISW